jgi:hypothetical protein
MITWPDMVDGGGGKAESGMVSPVPARMNLWFRSLEDVRGRVYGVQQRSAWASGRDKQQISD